MSKKPDIKVTVNFGRLMSGQELRALVKHVSADKFHHVEHGQGIVMGQAGSHEPDHIIVMGDSNSRFLTQKALYGEVVVASHTWDVMVLGLGYEDYEQVVLRAVTEFASKLEAAAKAWPQQVAICIACGAITHPQGDDGRRVCPVHGDAETRPVSVTLA